MWERCKILINNILLKRHIALGESHVHLLKIKNMVYS